MARSSKKDQFNANGDPSPKKEIDPLGALEKERGKLQERYDLLSGRARKEVGDVGFWGAVGAVALMADWAFLGGFGTVVAAWSAAEYIAYTRRAHEVGKELKDVKTRIHDMQQAQFELKIQQMKNAPQNAPGNDNSLKDEFSPAAKAEIEALRQKLSKLEGQVGQLQEDKEKGLDKPKFKKPFGKKPDGP